ncbi:hypothetical protein [Absidia glauca]|uniref:ENTH domain-containing protein n=1 Tax=Absidia glauca TaxID=4829 RepID=A0A163IYB7_ABSGL|nr:hypothetical protein [Absidia glauca]
METAVRKATRQDYNPPKQKHLSALVSLTFHNPAIIGEMLDLLERRHRENSWIMSFKVLVILHVLMRQGNGDRTIAYMEGHPACLDTTRLREKSSGVIHIQNIYLYTAYLQQKVEAYRELRVDYIKNTMASKVGRLRRLSIKDGLLKETMVLQKQVSALLKCKFVLDDVDNTISLFAFRLVVEDLLILFQAVNEGVVNILEHYFAMSKSDAQISLEIYKRFAKQTEEVTHFLDRARKFQHEMYISIPAAKHAPLSLAAALEEYLTDLKDQPPQQSKSLDTLPKSTPLEPEQPKELIDFFASLETDQTLSPAATPPPQPSLHNPFRNTVMPQTFIPADLNALPQQQQLLPPPLVVTTTSTPLPTNANPFRTNPPQQQPMMNTPSLGFAATPNPFMSPDPRLANGMNPYGMPPQQQQPWGSSSVF